VTQDKNDTDKDVTQRHRRWNSPHICEWIVIWDSALWSSNVNIHCKITTDTNRNRKEHI